MGLSRWMKAGIIIERRQTRRRAGLEAQEMECFIWGTLIIGCPRAEVQRAVVYMNLELKRHWGWRFEFGSIHCRLFKTTGLDSVNITIPIP